MKNLVLMAAAMTAALAARCEPDKYYAEFYTDEKCTKLDTKMTEKYGTVKQELYYQWKEQCNIVTDKLSYKLSCDYVGLHEKLYNGSSCDEKLKDNATYLNENCPEIYDKGSWIFQWDTCQPTPIGQGVYIIVRTTQFEND